MNFSFSQLFDQFNTVDSYSILTMLLIAFLFGFIVDRILMGVQNRKLRDGHEKQKRQISAQDKELENWREQTNTLKGEVEAANLELPGLRVEVDRLRSEIDQANDRALQADQEKNNLFGEIDNINTELEHLQVSSSNHLSTIEDLNNQIAHLKAQNQDLADQLENQPLSFVEQAPPAYDDDQMLVPEENILQEDPATISEGAPPGAAAPEIIGVEVTDTTEEGTEGDDFTLIKGIGPYIAKKLNNLGVFKFEQISEWDERHVRAVTEQLDYFEGRIVKDDWVGQARTLHRLKTEDPAAFEALNDKPKDANDLKIVEGVGPKIEKILKEAGIANWENLADASVEHLKAILGSAGDHFRIHDPKTWPIQARLAVNGHWDLLGEYQEQLIGGREIPPDQD